MESPVNEADYLRNVYKGWFIPPATTDYKFYTICDDHCSLKLSKAADKVADLTTLIDVRGAVGHRTSYTLQNDAKTRESEWVSLEKGKKYYIEGDMKEWSGSDHFTAAVEIKALTDTVKPHHQARPETQYLSVGLKDAKFEKTQVVIKNPGSGKFKLQFLGPDNKTKYTTDSLSTECTAKQLKDAVNYAYYRHKSGLSFWMRVALTVSEDKKTRTYDLTADRLLKRASATTITVLKSSSASITVTAPEKLQLSTLPISGKY